MGYIDKDVLVAEIAKQKQLIWPSNTGEMQVVSTPSKGEQGWLNALSWMNKTIDTLEVIDPYEQCVQYDSIKAGIQAHAETYSFNIESKLFNQLTKEQQALWIEEIEQAYTSGGEAGVELARDIRYKENVEVKEVNLENEIDEHWCEWAKEDGFHSIDFAKHFFELGMQVNNKAQK